jgi:hypothetical protein
LVAGLFLATGLVLSAMVLTRAWLHIAEPQTVSVTGSARRNVQSDLALWQGHCLVEAGDLIEAQRRLKQDLQRVESFLQARVGSNYTLTPIGIEEVRVSEREEGRVTRMVTAGYRLTQGVHVDSPEVERIVQLDRESVRLVEEGVLFTARPIEFIYTKAGEAKIEMLADATRDARDRADQIARQGGASVTRLRSARMGVFQITPLHSAETSWEGVYDTSSREKTITAVVSASFALR